MTVAVLVANRGEVAVRVQRSARKLGLRTVAVYAADDQFSAHVTGADAAVPLDGTSPQAYLDIGAIVDAAVETGCELLHPGYGFLSENPGRDPIVDRPGHRRLRLVRAPGRPASYRYVVSTAISGVAETPPCRDDRVSARDGCGGGARGAGRRRAACDRGRRHGSRPARGTRPGRSLAGLKPAWRLSAYARRSRDRRGEIDGLKHFGSARAQPERVGEVKPQAR